MDYGSGLSRNARMLPAKVAIICEDRSYTYDELNRIVNQMAHGLIALGIKKGDRVALMMKNSDYFAISFLAAAKLGAVLVPINFRLAKPEVEYILDHSDTKTVVCDEEYDLLIEEAKSSKVQHVIAVHKPSVKDHIPFSQVLAPNEADPDIEVNQIDDFEILYTSGTTGRPKGALFDQHRILAVTFNMMGGMGLNPQDRFLHIAPLFHSAQLNLFLLSGIFLGATHIIHREFDPIAVLKAIDEHKITIFFGVPAMYNFMLQVPNAQEFDLTSVARCGYGASPMAPEIVKKSMKLFGTDQFFNMCGLTEGGPGGIFLMPQDHLAKLGAGGKGLLLTEARVVDETGIDTAPGVVGELVLKGESVMKEYYKNPEATAEAIRNGWLYTGDLAVKDEDEFITLVDRKKDMIISGGENIYSVEVEQVLYAHPQVFEAAVIGLPHMAWGEMVTAIIVPKPGEVIDLDELQSFCRQSLAGYKIPRQIKLVDELPRNASGKVLKYQLRSDYVVSQ